MNNTVYTSAILFSRLWKSQSADRSTTAASTAATDDEFKPMLSTDLSTANGNAKHAETDASIGLPDI